MGWKKIRNYTGGLSVIQSQIIMLRGFTSEDNLMYQKDFINSLKSNKSTISYNIGVLKKRGLMTSLNFLTPDGKVVFQKLKDYDVSSKKFRGHKISGELFLKRPYARFDEERGKYKRIYKNPKYRSFQLELRECTILFYSPNKIIFYLPDVYGDSIEELYREAYENIILPLKEDMESMFEGLVVDDYKIASIQINHLAYLKHPLAEVFKNFNAQYKSDRIEVDHSHGVAELETVHKKHSVEDMDKILDYEKTIEGDKNGTKKD